MTMRIGLFATCLAESFTPRALIATVKVLERLGHVVEFPEQQTCCGQPMLNNGLPAEAATLARRMLHLFETHEVVVTPSASCAGMVRAHFAGLFAQGTQERERAQRLAAKTFELVEFLVERAPVDLEALGATWNGAVVQHYACHSRLLGLTDASARLLGGIAGLAQRPLEQREQCCGFGGTFALGYPQVSQQMVADKLRCLAASGAATVVCSDAGCLLNLEGAARRARQELRFVSAAEVVAEALGLLGGPR